MLALEKNSPLNRQDNPMTRDKDRTSSQNNVRVFRGHKGSVHRVVMPADGRFALTSGEDGTVRHWDLTSGFEESTIVTTANWFCGLALTTDGKRGAVGDLSGNIRLFNISRPRKILKWKAHQHIVGNLAFVAEGRSLISAAQGKYIRLWNAESGKRIQSWKSPFQRCFGVAASSDATQIVGAAVEEGLVFWPGFGGVETSSIRENIGNHSPVSLTADARFAYTCTEDGEIVQWDVLKGRRSAAFEGHTGSVSAIAVTADGHFCVSGGADKTVRIWATKTGQCLAILKGHRSTVWGVAITQDGRRVASVAGDGTLRVWDFSKTVLSAEGQSRRRGYVNAKIVLLGDSGVGKSGLAQRLWHSRWKKTDSSHGMEIRRLQLPDANTDGVDREVWLWDLAGQPDYRLTHQLFMEQTSLALLVFDPQDSRIFETIGYWQTALRKVARGKDVVGILVAARCDRPGLLLTLSEVKEWAAARNLHGPIFTAAKLNQHDGVTKLRTLIAQLIPWEKMEFRSTMDNFPSLKDAILAVREQSGIGGIVVKPEELESRIRKVAPNLSFSSEDLQAVTGLLAGEGVLHALPYGDLVVLQPSWVNCYASSLVKLAGEATSQLGHVPMETIQPGKLPKDGAPRLAVEDELQLLPALVALFLERALAWKQDTDKGTMLVFPNYVRLPRPTPPPRPGRTVIYRFKGPLEQIYCTLVVRLHYSGIFSETKLYRQAADFKTASGKLAALTMNEEGERGELQIYFGAGLDADVQAPFQQFVHDHLIAKALDVDRLRNFLCPKCGEVVTDRKVIDAAIAKKRTHIVCAYCDPKSPGLIDLNDVLERQFMTKQGEEGADQAGQKAGDEISAAAKEQKMVGEVMTLVASANQAFIPRVVRDEGTDGEIEFFSKAGKSTGVSYRVQLKSGDSHLKKLKDGTEMFSLKKHYPRYWAGSKTVPVLLIIRTSNGQIRYMNATNAILESQRLSHNRPVRQIRFEGKDFNKEAILELRDARLY